MAFTAREHCSDLIDQETKNPVLQVESVFLHFKYDMYHNKKGLIELIKISFFISFSVHRLQDCKLILKIAPKSIPDFSAPTIKTDFPSWTSHTVHTLCGDHN